MSIQLMSAAKCLANASLYAMVSQRITRMATSVSDLLRRETFTSWATVYSLDVTTPTGS